MRENFEHVNINHLLALIFLEGGEDFVQKGTEKKYEQVKKIKDHKTEVEDKFTRTRKI
jgi:hypothetical protein